MHIAGFVKNSLVDYPGIVCSTIFVSGCNFHCGFCHNPDLIVPKETDCISLANIFDYLKKAQGKLVDGVCITGGEPTLYPDELEDLIRELHSLNLKVKLDTNGSNPLLLERLRLDYIAVDFKTALERYRELTRIKDIEQRFSQTVDFLLKQNAIPYEFRTTMVPHLVGQIELKSIGTRIKGAQMWSLQHFNPRQTLDPQLEKLAPYSMQQMEQFFTLAKKFVSNVNVRG